MNEDFVSFDLAKKLKEKGYTLDTAHHYDYNGGIVVSLVEFDERCVYPCPEIHQVLKWLREEKKRLVVIHPEGHDVHYYYTIHNLARSFDTFEYTQSFATYESAAIAGIECCLDNLI